MSTSDSAQPRHGMVTSHATRGSYAMDVGLLLEWEVVALEGGKNFPDEKFGLAHDFGGVDEPVNLEPPSPLPPPVNPPADGLILSGGQSDRRKCLNLTDDQIIEEIKKNGNARAKANPEKWPRVPVTRGGQLIVEWTYHATHITRGYRWFITKDGWDENTPITREHFKGKNYVGDEHFSADSQDGLMFSDIKPWSPFSTDENRPKLQPKDITSAKLPDDKYGHHVILLAWIVAETDKAFYQTFDVDFDAPPHRKVWHGREG